MAKRKAKPEDQPAAVQQPPPKKGRGCIANTVLVLIFMCAGILVLAAVGNALPKTPTPAPPVAGQSTSTWTPEYFSKTPPPSVTFTPGPTKQGLPLTNTPRATQTPKIVVITSTPKPPPATVPNNETIISQAVKDKVNVNVDVGAADAEMITVVFDLSDLSAHFANFDVQYKFPKIACALRETGIKTKKYLIVGKIKVVDSFGTESKKFGATATISAARIAKFNCDNTDAINIATAADAYFIDPLIANQ